MKAQQAKGHGYLALYYVGLIYLCWHVILCERSQFPIILLEFVSLFNCFKDWTLIFFAYKLSFLVTLFTYFFEQFSRTISKQWA